MAKDGNGVILRQLRVLVDAGLKFMIQFRVQVAAAVIFIAGLGSTAAAVCVHSEAVSDPQAAEQAERTRPAREVPVCTHVELSGRNAISVQEIEDLTGLKVGNRMDPARIRLALNQISRLYLDRGYGRTRRRHKTDPRQVRGDRLPRHPGSRHRAPVYGSARSGGLGVQA